MLTYNRLHPIHPLPLDNLLAANVHEAIANLATRRNDGHVGHTGRLDGRGPVLEPFGHSGLARLMERDDIEAHIAMGSPDDGDDRLDLIRGQGIKGVLF